MILDRYDLRLGSDLPAFMESGLGNADRVLAVCTSKYVEKANGRKGGVGYESTILTADLMEDLSSDRIIPIIVRNNEKPLVPTFLRARMHIDFRDHLLYELRYDELVREIHDAPVIARPPLGDNPFRNEAVTGRPVRLSMQPDRYVSPATSGRISFPYENNGGGYTLGTGDLSFLTSWTSAGHGSIYAYSSGVKSVALAPTVSSLDALGDVGEYDNSSRHRTIRVGDCAVFENIQGYYCAVLVEEVTTRDTSPRGEAELTFSYAIQPNRTSDFSTMSNTP